MERVAKVLQEAYDTFLRESFSWRSYTLHAVFGLRYGRLKQLFRNEDAYILRRLRGAIELKNRSLFDEIAARIFCLFII